MSIGNPVENEHKSNEPIICPHCDGYGYLGDGEMPGPCITCGGSGWLTKSQLEE
jgi:hypothetical protein